MLDRWKVTSLVDRYVMILSCTAVLFCSGCKFNHSPYSAKTPELRLNEVNIKRIMNQESGVGSNFKVALISDTHNYYKNLSKLIDRLNETGPYAFVIVAGDISNLGLLEEYDESRRYFNQLRWPYIVAQGNHDLLSNGDVIYKKMFGNENFSFEYKNVQFVIFNNNNWESAGKVPDIVWVRNQLSSSSKPLRILVAHVSPVDRDRFKDEDINAWETVMNNFNVNYFINGHDHNPGEGGFGSGQRITVGAPSKRVYYDLIFTSGGVSHQKNTF